MSNNVSYNDKIHFIPIIRSKKIKYPEVQMNINDKYIKELFDTSIAMTGFISSSMNNDNIINEILWKLGSVRDYFIAQSGSDGVSKITVFFTDIFKIKKNKSSVQITNEEYKEEYVYDEFNECIELVEQPLENNVIDDNYSEENDDEFHFDDGCYWYDNCLHRIELYFY
jgi:hypothetical protein